MRFKSYVVHNLCKNEIMLSVPIFMARAVHVAITGLAYGTKLLLQYKLSSMIPT